jgi:hypothetical protein
MDYLTLPIPRIALTPAEGADSITEYLADKSGWLVLTPDAVDAPERVHAHVARSWSREELAAPASEAWPVVAEEIAHFARAHLLLSGRGASGARSDRAAGDPS